MFVKVKAANIVYGFVHRLFNQNLICYKSVTVLPSSFPVANNIVQILLSLPFLYSESILVRANKIQKKLKSKPKLRDNNECMLVSEMLKLSGWQISKIFSFSLDSSL